MLSAVFHFVLPEISTSSVLRDLLRSFSIERPVRVSRAQPWDLGMVLSFLRSSVFEPLDSVSLQEPTRNTLFLVALATAKRVGELQALSNVVTESGRDLVVSYLPYFVAKMENRSNPLLRFFRIPSLKDFALGLEEGALLCPVRALKIYRKRTEGFMRKGSALFGSPRCPTKGISKNAISFFLREVISSAGAVRIGEGQPLRAHSVRGMATSAAFLRNCSISKLLEAVTWRSNSVFPSFYFRDIQFVFKGVRSLGPFVSAGFVVHP